MNTLPLVVEAAKFCPELSEETEYHVTVVGVGVRVVQETPESTDLEIPLLCAAIIY